MNLHGDIMNIRIGKVVYDEFDSKIMAYKYGHRDARHAAAEMSIEVELKIKELESLLQEVYDYSTTKHGLDIKIARKVEKVLGINT